MIRLHLVDFDIHSLMSCPMDIKSDLGLLSWIQNWFGSQTDGDWEHQCGIKIETLDNPGWAIFIDLKTPKFRETQLVIKKWNEDEENWGTIGITNGKFEAFVGVKNLSYALYIFKEFIEKDAQSS